MLRMLIPVSQLLDRRSGGELTPIGAGASSRSSTARVNVLPSGKAGIPSAAYAILLNAPLSASFTSVQSTPSSSSAGPASPFPASSLSLSFTSPQTGNSATSKTQRSRTSKLLARCITTAILRTLAVCSCAATAATASEIHWQSPGCRDWCTGRL